jgi:hypothetical protein
MGTAKHFLRPQGQWLVHIGFQSRSMQQICAANISGCDRTSRALDCSLTAVVMSSMSFVPCFLGGLV